ncbi:hypothetical protein L544_0466 [Bordetella hinzii OH87 BAL007II]|uniref:Uncharacterized protein n=1 Tax=Bordetella hinzii OH87 BAL007II TaxID=1331262 RepID=A0ABR4QXL2_9BORD|nr:hypothetical protein L544_0466 [Bordetella hinzii OH87 BAL007II]
MRLTISRRDGEFIRLPGDGFHPTFKPGQRWIGLKLAACVCGDFIGWHTVLTEKSV